MREELELEELQTKVELIKFVRGEHHSAFKKAVMELENSNTRKCIDFEYDKALRLLEKLRLIDKL